MSHLDNQTINVAFLIGKSMHTCHNTSYIQWTKSWLEGKHTFKQACLTFKHPDDASGFWQENPEAHEAYSAARDFSDVLETVKT